MKREYIDALTYAYTSICQCGHAADLHAHHNGHDHPGDTALGVCGCVLSVQEAALIAQAGTIAQQRQTIDALTAALEEARGVPPQINTNPETPCAKCGSRVFVYLLSGKRECVVCKD